MHVFTLKYSKLRIWICCFIPTSEGFFNVYVALRYYLYVHIRVCSFTTSTEEIIVKMAISCPENSQIPSKRCRFFCPVLKDAFTHCHPCKQRRLSYSSTEEETPTTDFDDVQEVMKQLAFINFISIPSYINPSPQIGSSWVDLLNNCAFVSLLIKLT